MEGRGVSEHAGCLLEAGTWCSAYGLVRRGVWLLLLQDGGPTLVLARCRLPPRVAEFRTSVPAMRRRCSSTASSSCGVEGGEPWGSEDLARLASEEMKLLSVSVAPTAAGGRQAGRRSGSGQHSGVGVGAMSCVLCL